MAFKGKRIDNPVTGQSILFLQTAKDTNGALLEMESSFAPSSKEPAAHYHPNQQETFTVQEGELTVKLDGHVKVFKAGDSFFVDKNIVHSMWNASGEKTVVNWKVQPALNTEYMLETIIGLSVDGKTNDKGMPPLLQIALIAQRYSPVFRLSKPSFTIQKILFAVLSPFAYLAGYRSSYQKYID